LSTAYSMTCGHVGGVGGANSYQGIWLHLLRICLGPTPEDSEIKNILENPRCYCNMFLLPSFAVYLFPLASTDRGDVEWLDYRFRLLY